MGERAYTLGEIDRLRNEIRGRHFEIDDCWDTKYLDESVEEQLRTALLAGVEPPKQQTVEEFKEYLKANPPW